MDSDNNNSDNEDSYSEIQNLIISFRRTHKAEVRNSKILAAFNGDLGAAITAQIYSPVNYGSEFCDTAPLEKIFIYHENRASARVSLLSRSNQRGNTKIRFICNDTQGKS